MGAAAPHSGRRRCCGYRNPTAVAPLMNGPSPIGDAPFISWDGTVDRCVYPGDRVSLLRGRDPVAVVDGQGIQDGLPAVDSAGRIRPVLAPLDRCEIQHLEGGVDSAGQCNTSD